MGLRDLFGKKGKDKDTDAEPDPIADLVLDKLKVGYLVDYDLKTWEVTGYCRYEFDGNIVKEWEITAGGREKRYLELADGRWSLAKKSSSAPSTVTSGVTSFATRTRRARLLTRGSSTISIIPVQGTCSPTARVPATR